jgi:hypothetical protein
MVNLQFQDTYRPQAGLGFRPAFLDSMTCAIYLSRHRDGTAASYHSADGLPDALVTRERLTGRVLSMKSTLVRGFERNGFFYTCTAAARAVGAVPDDMRREDNRECRWKRAMGRRAKPKVSNETFV